MHALAVSLWMLRRTLGSPIGWIWLLASILAAPLLAALIPITLSDLDSSRSRLLVQVALLSSLTGAMLAIATLAESEWILKRASSIQELSTRLVGIGLMATLGGLICTLSASFLPFFVLSPPALVAVACSIGHLALLGSLVLSLPVTTIQRVAALPLLVWILPAASSPETVVGRATISLLQVHQDPARFRGGGPVEFLEAAAPLIVFAAAGVLLALRRPRSLRS